MSGDVGAGVAVSVKVADAPSVTPDPAAIVTSGSGGASSSWMETVPEAEDPTV